MPIISPKRFNDEHKQHLSQARNTGYLDKIIDDNKPCSGCSQTLPLSQFHKSSKRTNGYALWCKRCGLNHKKDRYANGRKIPVKAMVRKYQLKKNYGLTLEQYDLLLLHQNGCCAICGKPETQRSNPNGIIDSLRVDHCHTTGKIRGLLCSKCNFGISQFNDDTILLNQAIKYLSKELKK